MEIQKIIFDSGSFSITRKSLKNLRDAIAGRLYHRLVVVEVPTDETCCGFFIFDEILGEAVWTGDGFRTDENGEAGAGYRTAWAIFNIFGIRPLFWEQINMNDLTSPEASDEEKRLFLLLVAKKIGRQLEAEDFVVPSEANPHYLRYIGLVSLGRKKMGSNGEVVNLR